MIKTFIRYSPLLILAVAWETVARLHLVPEAQAMSRALKQRGFRFVGPTICYAFMQAVGMVNDHVVDCFRWRQLRSPRMS